MKHSIALINKKKMLKKRESNSLSPTSPNQKVDIMCFSTALPINILDEKEIRCGSNDSER